MHRPRGGACGRVHLSLPTAGQVSGTVPPLYTIPNRPPLVALLQAQDIAPLPHLSPEPPHRLPAGQGSQDDDVRPAKRQRFGTPGSDNGTDRKPAVSNLSDDDESDEDELGMLKVRLCRPCAQLLRVVDIHTDYVCLVDSHTTLYVFP